MVMAMSNFSPVPIRRCDGAIKCRVGAVEGFMIQQGPQKRERHGIVRRDLEVELCKPAGIGTGRVEDVNEWSCDTKAPSEALGDTVTHRGSPGRRGILAPRGYEKSGNRAALRLEQRREPHR